MLFLFIIETLVLLFLGGLTMEETKTGITNEAVNNDILINSIITSVYDKLNDEQIDSLRMSLYISMSQYDILPKSQLPNVINQDWQELLSAYLDSKRISGKSKSTINQYNYHLVKMLSVINKSIVDITSGDVCLYFETYKKLSRQYGHNISNRSLENMRLVFSAFFNWCVKNGIIPISPMATFASIKFRSELKEPFTDEERELLFYHAKTKRDKAMLEFFYSTGVRVSELINVNIEDVNFKTKEIKVLGKGNKERIVYLNSKSCIYLKKYLQSRTDDSKPLFVSLYKPHNRLTVGGVENILKKLGNTAGIKNVHPHRFRRTTATNALEGGMELLYVSELLGHENVNTTTIYTKANRNKVKAAHEKYLHS